MTSPKQRIDKWLWHARFVKTRSLAQKLVTSGKVRVDREKTTSASHQVCPGNVLTITLAREIKIIEIVALADRRGPFSDAQTLYIDLSPPKQSEIKEEDKMKDLSIIESSGRPTKHQRKKIMQLKRNSTE